MAGEYELQIGDVFHLTDSPEQGSWRVKRGEDGTPEIVKYRECKVEKSVNAAMHAYWQRRESTINLRLLPWR